MCRPQWLRRDLDAGAAFSSVRRAVSQSRYSRRGGGDTTRRIQIRAGSVVVAFQDTLRVAEEWSVIDNLSGGRVGIACASGWHVNDSCWRRRITSAAGKSWPRGSPLFKNSGAASRSLCRMAPASSSKCASIRNRFSLICRSGSPVTAMQLCQSRRDRRHVLTVLWDTHMEDLARRIGSIAKRGRKAVSIRNRAK